MPWPAQTRWPDTVRDTARRLRDRWRHGSPPAPEPWTGSGLRVLAEAPGAFTAASWREAFACVTPDLACDLRVSRHPDERRLLLPDADVYLTGTVSEADLALSSRLRLLHTLSAGADSVRRLPQRPGLTVCTAVGVAAHGLAEHALALMLALSRKLPGAVRRLESWTWKAPSDDRRPFEWRGRTVAVLGMGHAGRVLCELLQPLGVQLVTWDGRAVPGVPPPGVTGLPTLEAALRTADAVVLLLPDTPSTRGLFDAATLRGMRQGAYLVNVSRGSLVDHAALAGLLRSGHLGGAGLDVLDVEPPGRRHPLRNCPNLILTPHIAGNMHAYHKDIQTRCVDNVHRLATGAPLVGVLTPEDDPQPQRTATGV